MAFNLLLLIQMVYILICNVSVTIPIKEVCETLKQTLLNL